MNHYQQEALDFIERNPHQYELFNRFAWELLNRGYKTLSAYLIFERMRWETAVTSDEEFKVNNNYRPYFARKWMDDHKMPGVFRTRRTRA